MNTDRIEGNWEQVKGYVQKQWGKLTDDDLDVIEGNRKMLAGKIQERYGSAKDVVEKEVALWNQQSEERAEKRAEERDSSL